MSISNPYVSRTWKDRQSEYPTRRILTDTTTLETQQVTVTRDEGTVTEQGDNWDASNLNAMESRINTAFSALSACGFVEVMGTLSSGATTCVITTSSITTTATYDIFCDMYGLAPESVGVLEGEMTLTFEAQASDVSVKVRVY